jgi:hypothetical protein
MFEARFNANDFFHYATAQMVSIVADDFDWVLEHIDKYPNEGMWACMAYIQNCEPLPPYRNDEFNQAIKELVDRKQEVIGDSDWEFHYYDDGGPYRTINKD